MSDDTRYRDLLNSLQAGVFEMDQTGRVTYANKAALDFLGHPEDQLEKGINAFDSVAPEEHETMVVRMKRTLAGNIQGIREYTIVRTDGRRFPVLVQASPIIKDGNAVGIRGVMLDNSTDRRSDNRAHWLSTHDPLTGLCNRSHFDQEILRLKTLGATSCGVIICDVDGLKLVNDTWGHRKGDALLMAVALILQEIAKDGVVARLGGDEFGILLPNADRATLESTCARISEAVSNYSSGWEFPLGTSVGFAYAESASDLDRALRQADAAMYLEKLRRSQSVRSAVVQTLIKALNHKDFGSSRVNRLQNLTVELGEVLGYPSYRFPDLRRFARLHDIGKVAIPDAILFKPAPLTPEESAEMRRHCEIGYRIATSTPDLVPIADWILKHHERWDGTGYPLGLSGRDIPMECRLFAIADAFCAMTGHRPYREPMSPAEAVAEIKRCAGTQFDPTLVNQLIGVLEAKANTAS